MANYLTAPVKTNRMPPGVPYIVGNEGAERFSYYGMRAILVVFMTQYLLNRSGVRDPMSPEEAKEYYHWWMSSVYFFPFFGALVADLWLGKYRTIISLSIVYCLGHLALALDSTRLGLAIGLTLIAIGSGGIKPCVSANVGDQFGASNQHLLPKVYGWFYFAINCGSFISMLLTPYLLNIVGPQVAFGVPGLLMFIATVVFWLGRNKFAHVPPDREEFAREIRSPTGLKALGRLVVIYIFVAVFWSLYDQTGSAWVLQAQKMAPATLFGRTVLPAQMQSLNPLLILIYIPLFSYAIYPAIDKIFPLTALRKIGIGFVVTFCSFLIPAWVELLIGKGAAPNLLWQAASYAVLTAGEVFVSITCLEFSYTQAPKKMKSFVMALFLLSVSLGDAFTAMVNHFIRNPDKTSKLPGASYYLFFAGLMLVTAILFVFVALRFKEQRFLQDESA